MAQTQRRCKQQKYMKRSGVACCCFQARATRKVAAVAGQVLLRVQENVASMPSRPHSKLPQHAQYRSKAPARYISPR